MHIYCGMKFYNKKALHQMNICLRFPVDTIFKTAFEMSVENLGNDMRSAKQSCHQLGGKKQQTSSAEWQHHKGKKSPPPLSMKMVWSPQMSWYSFSNQPTLWNERGSELLLYKWRYLHIETPKVSQRNTTKLGKR